MSEKKLGRPAKPLPTLDKSISQSLRDYRRAKDAERMRWNMLLGQIAEAVISGSLSLREASQLTGIHRKTITAVVEDQAVKPL